MADSTPGVWPEVSSMVADALRAVVEATRASVPEGHGYWLEVPSNYPEPYLHVESVLLVHGPHEIPGAEDAEITILFEAVRIERNSWLKDEIEQDVPPGSEVAYLSIDYETGGGGRLLTPLVLPPRKPEAGYADALTKYGFRAVTFLREHTNEMLDLLRDRARSKGIV